MKWREKSFARGQAFSTVLSEWDFAKSSDRSSVMASPQATRTISVIPSVPPCSVSACLSLTNWGQDSRPRLWFRKKKKNQTGTNWCMVWRRLSLFCGIKGTRFLCTMHLDGGENVGGGRNYTLSYGATNNAPMRRWHFFSTHIPRDQKKHAVKIRTLYFRREGVTSPLYYVCRCFSWLNDKS